MLEKLKGIRTYLTLAVIGISGVLVAIQTSCSTDPTLAEVCKHIPLSKLGVAISVLAAIAAWFRKLAGTGK